MNGLELFPHISAAASLGWLVAIPLLTAILVLFTEEPHARTGFIVLGALAMFGIALSLYSNITDQQSPLLVLLQFSPALSIGFKLEPLGLLFILLVSFLWGVTALYSHDYIRLTQLKNPSRFHFLFSVAIACTAGVALSENLLTLFIFYELLTLITCLLVAYKNTPESLSAARYYISVLLGNSIVFFLPAIAFVYFKTGSLSFATGGIAGDHFTQIETFLLLVLFAFGIAKLALIPFHGWLPRAMVAPTPVSALLHAVAVVKTGAFTLIKITVYIFGRENLLTISGESSAVANLYLLLGGFTLIVASVCAMRKDNLKLRLAYSTIAQLGLIVAGIGVFAENALLGTSYQLLSHAIAKITLFFAAGMFAVLHKKTTVSSLTGLAKKMPLTAAAFTIASLSLIGLPPFIGMTGKYYLLAGSLQVSHYYALVLFIISTLLTAAYLVPVVLELYKTNGSEIKSLTSSEAPPTMLFAVMLTAGLCIGLFFYPDMFINLCFLLSVR